MREREGVALEVLRDAVRGSKDVRIEDVSRIETGPELGEHFVLWVDGERGVRAYRVSVDEVDG